MDVVVVMKEDAIPFYGLSFCFAAVMEMEDVETPAMDVVVVTTYGSSFFYSAAVTETVTESAVSNHKPKKAAWFGSLFSFPCMMKNMLLLSPLIFPSIFFGYILLFFFLSLNRKFTF